jgi:hypothetical protein
VNAKFEAFSNSLRKPENIWINCEVFVLMKINDWVSAALKGQVIYDNLTPVPLYKKVQGKKTTRWIRAEDAGKASVWFMLVSDFISDKKKCKT